jgi:hypothetical protein
VSELAADEHVEVAATVHDLWLLRWDFSRLPEYNAGVGNVRRTRPPGGDGSGSRFEFDLATPAGPRRVVLDVTESVTDRVVGAVMNGTVGATERFVVEPVAGDDERCRARLTLWVDVPDDLAAEARHAILENGRHEVRRELDAMRHILESRPSST